MAAYGKQYCLIRRSHPSPVISKSPEASKHASPRRSFKCRGKRSQSPSIQNSTVKFSDYQNNTECLESLRSYQLVVFMRRMFDARKACLKHDISPWLQDQFWYTLISSSALCNCEDDCEDLMVYMVDAQHSPSNLNSPSSWQSWQSDIVKMREPPKANFSCHGYQSPNGYCSCATSALDCVPDPNHPVEGGLYTGTLLHEEDICERDRVTSWKDGPGRQKEWRSISRYLTSKRKRKGAEFQVISSERASKSPFKVAGVHLHVKKAPWRIAIPRNMLMQKSSCYGLPLSSKPGSSMQLVNNLELKLRYTRKTKTWDNNDFLPQKFPILSGFGGDLSLEEDTIDDTIDDSASPSIPEPTLASSLTSARFEASDPWFRGMNAKRKSLDHLLPYEAFVNTILGGCLCLKGLRSTEPHYEVYAAESLSDRNQTFAVRAYTLRGLAPRVRDYRIRNLKRAATGRSCVGSLEQGGKKWLVFTEARAEPVPESFRDCGPVWRARDDYDRAFPVLGSSKLYNPEINEKETPQDEIAVVAYNARVDGLRELLVTSFNSCHRYEKYKLFSEKPKRIKTPEQGLQLKRPAAALEANKTEGKGRSKNGCECLGKRLCGEG